MLACGVVSLAFAAGPARAQELPLLGEEETEGLPEIRRYSVELIVFEYTATAADDNEIFLPEEGAAPPLEDLPTLDDADIVPTYSDRGFADPGSGGRVGEIGDSGISRDDAVAVLPPELVTEEDRLEEIPIPRRQVNLFSLLPSEYTMNGIYDKLEALDAYVPLLHTGWSQATPAEVESPAIPLRALGNPPLRLDGELTLYLGNYLHLVVNLSLEQAPEPAGPYPRRTGPVFGDAGRLERYPASRETPPLRYRISEDRIVRSGELRYFDHPKFGVLARVLRVEEELEEIEVKHDIRGLTDTPD